MHHAHTRCFLLTALSLLCAAPPAEANTLRDRVELALCDIERIPSKEVLLSLDPDVATLLNDIALRPSRRMLAQTRAISLLRLFPSKRTTATLRQIIQKRRSSKRGLDLLNLQQALTSYAVVVGPASLATIQPFLSHTKIDVRYAAAEALQLSHHPRSIELLTRRQQLEREPLVRHQLQKQIKRIQNRSRTAPRR